MGKDPPLGVRVLVAATRRKGLRQRRGLFPGACRLSEGSELLLVPAEVMGRSWREGRPGMYSGPVLLKAESRPRAYCRFFSLPQCLELYTQ